ncbi:winged helix-turn-helix transcriptional regulator [Streptomyces sp. ISL-66]|uniref:winged helix-turn-helix transcriptional regulator n=1 Tax=Streptomyces sp. ISL-66 TaxID=2819186 RepID=UPI0027E3C008|nr:winged helix-turn-helix transcriptional regulator [Streptomyces sp. ISL-66]
MGGLGPKVLNDALRGLESTGLVERRAYARAPPRVDYGLTEPGEALLVPIRADPSGPGGRGSTCLTSPNRDISCCP